MTMRRPIQTISISALFGYALALIALAEKHSSALPKGPERIARLRARLAALKELHEAWSADGDEQKAAFHARSAAFNEGMKVYTSTREWAAVLVEDGEGGETLRDVLSGSLCPSLVTPADAPLMFQYLARGVENHVDAFASVKVDVATAASLRAHARAVEAVSTGVATAESERSEASTLRQKARENLVSEIRSLERYLKKILTEAGSNGLETLRDRYLPRYAQSAQGGSEEPTE